MLLSPTLFARPKRAVFVCTPQTTATAGPPTTMTRREAGKQPDHPAYSSPDTAG
jgi:hypothetical protein